MIVCGDIMNEVEVKVVLNNKELVKRATKDAIDSGLDLWGMHAADQSALELESDPRRVDTGLLRNSITHALGGGSPKKTTYHADNAKRDGTFGIGSYSGTAPSDKKGERSVYVGSNVEYAAYVHEGTSRMTPNRFLENGVKKSSSEGQRILEQQLARINDI